jgi:hypothetical protein
MTYRLAVGSGTSYSITNPLQAQNLTDVIKAVGSAIVNVVIPIAVIMYVWAGFLYLTAGAKPDNINKAKDIFKWTTIGLAIVLIGGGFVDLIRSILNAGR